MVEKPRGPRLTANQRCRFNMVHLIDGALIYVFGGFDAIHVHAKLQYLLSNHMPSLGKLSAFTLQASHKATQVHRHNLAYFAVDTIPTFIANCRNKTNQLQYLETYISVIESPRYAVPLPWSKGATTQLETQRRDRFSSQLMIPPLRPMKDVIILVPPLMKELAKKLPQIPIIRLLREPQPSHVQHVLQKLIRQSVT